jgi:hypothetical protein
LIKKTKKIFIFLKKQGISSNNKKTLLNLEEVGIGFGERAGSS